MSRDPIIRSVNLLIQVAGWSFFILAPIVSQSERFFSHPMMLTEFLIRQVLNVVFFYFNYYYLIPKILRQKGMKKYVFGVLVTFLSIFILQNLVENLIKAHHFHISFISIVGMVQLYAISTTLRMLVDSITESNRKKLLEKEKQKAELSYLRSQINPHFLFNTLNNINSLIRKNPEAAEQAVVRLSFLMRYMLNSSNKESIPLAEEMEYIRNYIELQKLRLAKNFDLKFETKGCDISQAIEPLLLIGFIENPFKHALSGEETDFIDIRIECDGKNLELETKNSISGSKSEMVESGVGIENVKKRLKLSYPNKHELEILKTDAAFCVKLKMEI